MKGRHRYKGQKAEGAEKAERGRKGRKGGKGRKEKYEDRFDKEKITYHQIRVDPVSHDRALVVQQ